MDQNHRPFIHRTYGAAVRVAIAERMAFSLTRFGSWPIMLPGVRRAFQGRTVLYQVICLFGLIVVVNVIECHGGPDARMEIDWAIASHRFLRFLHGPRSIM